MILQVGDKLFSFVHFESPTPSGESPHSSAHTDCSVAHAIISIACALSESLSHKLVCAFFVQLFTCWSWSKT